MAAALTTRRNCIISGFLLMASVPLSAGILSGTSSPEWLEPLLRRLNGITTWVRPEIDDEGNAVIHCAVKEASIWAKHAGGLAGPGGKVRASGNVLSFSQSGRKVSIVLHAHTA